MVDMCDEKQLQSTAQRKYFLWLESVPKKARIYSDVESLDSLCGLDLPSEIEYTAKGLAEGKKEAFLALVEYLWLELVDTHSLLWGPLEEFISKHTAIRVSLPSPIMPIIFFMSGRRLLKEWCMMNMYDLTNTAAHSLNLNGRNRFYQLHLEIQNSQSSISETQYLHGLYVFVCLGGVLCAPHTALLLKTIDEEACPVQTKFAVYKVFLAQVLDREGKIKPQTDESASTTKNILHVLESLLKSDMPAFLQAAHQAPSAINFLVIYTPWQILEASLQIEAVCAEPVIALGKKLHAPTAVLSFFSLMHRLVNTNRLGIASMFDAQSMQMLDTVISRGDSGILSFLATVTVSLIYNPPNGLLSVGKAVLLRICPLWIKKLAEESPPQCIVEKFVFIAFFQRIETVLYRYVSESDPTNMRKLVVLINTLHQHTLQKLRTIPLESLAPSIAPMALTVQLKKSVPVPVLQIVAVLNSISFVYKHTNMFPVHLEDFCSLIEKAADSAGWSDLFLLLSTLAELPMVSILLSQINYIIITMKAFTAEPGIEKVFPVVFGLNLTKTTKVHLKSTFIKNVLELYLDTSQRKGDLQKMEQIVNAWLHANHIAKDPALTRLISRLSRTHAKHKDAFASEKMHPKMEIVMPVVASVPVPRVLNSELLGRIPYTNEKFISFLLKPTTLPPYYSPKEKYACFEEYYNVFNRLLMQEAQAFLRNEQEDLGESKEVTNGVVVGKTHKSNEVILQIKVENIAIFTTNNFIVLFNNDAGTVAGKGLVSSINKPKACIHVRFSSIEFTNSFSAQVTILGSMSTILREYNAMLYLQFQDAMRKRIFDPQMPLRRFLMLPENGHADKALQKSLGDIRASLNPAQKAVIAHVLTHDLTLVQGPPGTGKTTCISALILECLLKGLSVLVCAPSNAAVNMLVESIAPWRKYYSGPVIHIGEYKSSEELPLRRNLVFSTLSMSRSLFFTNVAHSSYNVLIIDEACQATETSTLIPLHTAPTRIVLVGDPQQLPPTVLSDDKNFEKPLFTRLSAYHPPLLLNVQYRMHKDIAGFSNAFFYEGKLCNGVDRKSPLPVAFIDVCNGKEKSTADAAISNPKEASAVAELYQHVSKLYSSCGVVTPYNRQVACLKKLLPSTQCVTTIDGFQGQEKDCIVLSTVRTSGIGFLKDVRRMNVALTRAKYCLIVVGNSALLQKNSMWNEFLKYCKEKECVYTLEKVVSILKTAYQKSKAEKDKETDKDKET